MIRHSVFLRSGCILPDQVHPPRTSFGDHWTEVQNIQAPALDALIRRAGWHFTWVKGPCSRRGVGPTKDSATHRALTRALNGMARRFNAAEFDALEITRYPGFYVAKVTIQARKIQQHTSLDTDGETLPPALFAK